MTAGRSVLRIAVISVASLGLAVLTAWLALHAARTVAAPPGNQREAVALAFAQALSGPLETLVTEAQRAATALSPWSGSPADVTAARSTLDAFADPPAPFDRAFVVGLDSRAVAVSASASAVQGQVRDWEFVADAALGQPSGSGVVQDPIERRPLVGAAAPLQDEQGEVTGVMVGLTEVAGSRVAATLAGLGNTVAVEVALVDPQGQVVHAGTAAVEPASADTIAPARAAATGPGTMNYPGTAGVLRSAAYAPVQGGWSVVLHEDAAGLAPDTDRAIVPALIPLAALTVLSVGAAAVLDARSRRVAAQADSTKRAFLAVTGHELRTPLTVMSGMLQTLVARGDALPAEYRSRAIEAMSRQAKHLERLVERMLFVAHLESGLPLGVTTRPTDVGPILQLTVEQQRSRSPLHELVLEVASPLVAEADAKRLDEVVSELIENAVRYSPNGGTVRVTAHRTGRSVEIAVEDSGVGLPADATRIFEKFVQGETVDTRVQDEGGVGLGLYIVRTLTEAMGGTVDVERRKSGGTRVAITLRSGSPSAA